MGAVIRGWVDIFLVFLPIPLPPICSMYGIGSSFKKEKTGFSKFLLSVLFLYSVVICKTQGQIDTYFWMEFHPRRGLMALAPRGLWHNYRHMAQHSWKQITRRERCGNISIIESWEFAELFFFRDPNVACLWSALKFLFGHLSWAKHNGGLEGGWAKGGVCIWDADPYLTLK